VSLPGRVDPVSQRLMVAPNLKWADFDIKKAIEQRIPLQVEMDNAANACLLSELWFGRMDGIRNAVLVTISEGVGAAILANGQLVTGKAGLAGEFGHVPIISGGLACGCGRSGCWEMYASSRAALRYYAELVPKAAPLTIRELMNRAEDGDRKAVEALSRQATFLGQGLRLIATALSPELILLTGDLTISWPKFGPIVEAELKSGMLADVAPRLMVTMDAELARLRGAAALVLQRHSGYHRSPRLSPEKKQAGRRKPSSKQVSAAASR
jgi:predicted NBD/HSP70 family sugar kinase